MTNLSLNSEVIRRVNGALFLNRYRLTVVASGYAFVDCRDSAMQYCGTCPLCLAYDDRSVELSTLEQRLASCELSLANSENLVEQLRQINRSMHDRSAEVSDLEGRIVSCELSLATSEDLVEQLRRINRSMHNRLYLANASVTRYANGKQSLQDRIAQLESENASLRQQLAASPQPTENSKPAPSPAPGLPLSLQVPPPTCPCVLC